ncbi:MAG: PEP-CTERM sorting domain-containing protein [Candidatus Accumulibacter sp.]|nr:PEP-CTERM sorting domain-containing protein [Accumulibacter sp.]
MAAAAASAGAGQAISGAIPAGTALFSDNSAEQWLDNNGNKILDVGDALRGIFSIDNITDVAANNQIAIGTGTVYNELTGLFQVLVTGMAPLSATRANYEFGFDPSFGMGAGVVGVLYEDPAQNFARTGCGTFAGCEATATGGNLWMTVGLGGDAFWSAANAAIDPSIGAVLPLTTPLGNFGMGLNIITNNSGFSWNQVDCVDTVSFTVHTVDVCGQGGILATGKDLPPGSNKAITPYSIFDNVDFTLNRVPEPGSMALIGLALVGLGAARGRKSVK